MAWTDAQTKAIETKDKTILVSAAAGSGKTTTLTERIIRSVTDDENCADIGRLLVVTFTKTAATDLKNKISRALTKKLAEDPKNKHLSRQMLKLGSADICTIDSFYYKALKENFDRLGLPSHLKVMDKNESKVLSETIMSDVIDDFYEKEERGGDFWRFMDCFSDSKGTFVAIPSLLNLYKKLDGYTEGIEYLRKNAEILEKEAGMPFFETRAGKIVAETCLRFFSHAEKVYTDGLDVILKDEIANKKYGSSFTYDLEHFRLTAAAIKNCDYTEAKRLFDGYSKINLGILTNADQIFVEIKSQRVICQNRYKELKKMFFMSDEEQCEKDALDTASFCRMAYKVLSEFENRFMEEKKRRGVCDFSDLKHFSLKLFIDADGNPTELATEYSKRYDEIYIDEYQDTDFVQDRIFNAISRGNNRFMVGDIKQSIYRFRGANPDVFAGYKKTFPFIDDSDDSDCCSIYMSENFRCDSPVISFTNLVCGYLFSHAPDSIGYTENDALIFHKEIEPVGREMTEVSFDALKSYTVPALAKMEEGERVKFAGGGRDLEIRRVVSRIKALLSNPDEKCEDNKVLRHIEPRDIAVLVSANKDADLFAKALTSAGIPTSVRTDVNYFDNPEVLLIFSLLNVIDNPQKDVYLAGVLRSPLFGLSFDDIIEIRNTGDGKSSLYDDVLTASRESDNERLKEKLSYFLSKLDIYREKTREMTVDKLLRFIYSDTMILSFAGMSSENKISTSTRRANLLLLYDYARKFESNSYKGLYSFISYINDIIESGEEIDPPASEANTNVVSVITIHHSKGLEFPVCFLCTLDKKFDGNKNKKNKGIQFDHSVGIGVKFGHESGFAKLTNMIFEAVKAKIEQEEHEEKIRLLYVAMTRARERLYLSASVGNVDEIETNSILTYSDEEVVLGKESLLDFIILAVSATGYELKTNLLEPYEVPKIEDTLTYISPENAEDKEEEERIYSLISECYAFEYPYAYLSKLPAKLSVSKLYPTVLDDTEDDGRKGEITLDELPRFLIPKEKRASATEKGTATHTFMQFCDFHNACENGMEAELARMCDAGLIAHESAKLIQLDLINKFFESDFYREISSCKKMWREKRFHIKLPASEFTADAKLEAKLDKEEIVVQGVIDLIFEDSDGNIVLCDYKTDALTAEELRSPALAAKKLADRHRLQLTYYAEAVRQIFGKVPSRVCIYSLPLGEAVDVIL